MARPRKRNAKKVTKKPGKAEQPVKHDPRKHLPKLYSEQQIFFKVKNFTLMFKTGFRKLLSEVDPIYAAGRLDYYWKMKAISTLMWLLTKN